MTVHSTWRKPSEYCYAQSQNGQNRGLASSKHHEREVRTGSFDTRLPVPNVAFWSCKKWAPNQQPPWARQPNVAFWSCMTLAPNATAGPPKLWTRQFQTPWEWGTKGRTSPSAGSCLCLTLLSDAARNEFQFPACKPSKLSLRTTEAPWN